MNFVGRFVAVAALALIVSITPGGGRDACAQVAVTLGAQEMYDDNIYLEDDKRRPPFVVSDDVIEEDIKRGRVPTLLGEEIDGDKNDDLITNLSVGLAGEIPVAQRYATTILQSQVGVLLFSDQTSQDRFTIDGRLESSATEGFLPQPFYATVVNEFASNSSDSTAAEGTATQTTQTYVLTGRTGVRDVDIAPRTDFGLGYVGSLHTFLGELRFQDEGPGEVQEEGADYTSHTAEAEIGYDVSQDLRLALVGTAGVQLFSSTDSDTLDGGAQDEGELDRANYTGTANARYQASKKLSVNGSVGVAQSSRFDAPVPQEVTTFDSDGQPITVIFEPSKNDSTLIFRFAGEYSFEPGSSIELGVDQSVGTDIQGDRIASRSVFGNGTKSITDRVAFTVGTRFLQYSSDDSLSNPVDRFEGSTSLSYLVAQQTTILLGYNYVDQTTSDDQLDDQLDFRAEDYQANRVFLGINVGFVGLPL